MTAKSERPTAAVASDLDVAIEAERREAAALAAKAVQALCHARASLDGLLIYGSLPEQAATELRPIIESVFEQETQMWMWTLRASLRPNANPEEGSNE